MPSRVRWPTHSRRRTRGIIHRDLKPANIKVRDDGTVKVLDFGLAKALDPVGQSSAAAAMTNSPTLTFAGTQAGVILGTAAYMSPEQAKGRTADKRSDVWAFGCVLYEMLTGKRAFAGEDVSRIPSWRSCATRQLERDTGRRAPIRTLTKGCLEKDRHTRISDIAVAKYVLLDGGSTGSAGRTVQVGGPTGSTLRTVAFRIAALVGVALVATIVT